MALCSPGPFDTNGPRLIIHINSMVLTWLTLDSSMDVMFERFSRRARRVVVLSQEEARRLQHNYIGTEHVLLGLLGENEGIAARALDRFGMTLPDARKDVEARIGRGKHQVSGHIPFTPRAKKSLELSLREALELHHNYIGTEHLLLGLIREGHGVAAQMIATQAGDLAAVRQAVLDLVPAGSARPGRRLAWARAWPGLGRAGEAAEEAAEPGEPEEVHTTPAADSSLSEAARLAGGHLVGSHHLLLAALSDPDTAAARALAGLGVDLDRAREALRNADVTDTTDELPEEAGRRHMVLRVSDQQLTIEATDAVIVDLARSVVEALQEAEQAEPGTQPQEQGTEPAPARKPQAAPRGPAETGQPGQTGTIRGDLPASASLAEVWQALRDSLEDIRRRARLAARKPEPSPDQPGQPDQPGEPGKLDEPNQPLSGPEEESA
jgi:ATP-dependent Clp protease ATP-binding subunit ClpC